MDPTHVIILTIGVCVCDGGVFTYLCCGWGFLHMSFLSTQNSSHSHYNGWKEISKDMENLPFKESGVFLWCIATGLPPFLKHEEHGFFLLWRCDRFLPKIFLPRFMDATFPKLDIKTHWTPPWFFKDLNQKSEENSFGMEPILWVQLLKCPVFSSPAASKKKKTTRKFRAWFPTGGSPIFFGTCCAGMDLEWSHERSGWLWGSHRKQGQMDGDKRGDWIERKGRTSRKDIKESDKSKKTKEKHHSNMSC